MAEGLPVADTSMVPRTADEAFCCVCGLFKPLNAETMMCLSCLRSKFNITEGLQKQVKVGHCPRCERYLQPPRTWIKAPLESKELVTFCIKRLKNLNKVRLVEAGFNWTKPNSRRLKLELKIQKEVLNGKFLEEAYTVEYVVQDMMCSRCVLVLTHPSSNPSPDEVMRGEMLWDLSDEFLDSMVRQGSDAARKRRRRARKRERERERVTETGGEGKAEREADGEAERERGGRAVGEGGGRGSGRSP